MTTNTQAVSSVASAESKRDHSLFQPESGLWVALRNAPSDYSHDEALLLCETFPGEWVSWVPGFGEITLSRGQFHQTEQV
ncbi:MAG: hypothetical protein AB8B99_19840 [Phormidesmis sp.]